MFRRPSSPGHRAFTGAGHAGAMAQSPRPPAPAPPAPAPPAPPAAPRLLVSLSGIRGDTLLAAARADADLRSRGIAPALLVAPHQGRDQALRDCPATLAWLRRRRAAGAELLLAGYDVSARGRRGELAALDHYEARLRLAAASRQLAALGLGTDLLAPPRWLLSPGARSAAAELGFRIAADAHAIHHLRTGRAEPIRVLALGEGFGGSAAWRRAVGAAVSRSIAAGRPIRLSAAASRLGRPRVRRELLGIVDAALAAGARPEGYAAAAGRLAA